MDQIHFSGIERFTQFFAGEKSVVLFLNCSSLCFRGGVALSGQEAAEALGISPRTADRLWLYARTWLLNKLQR